MPYRISKEAVSDLEAILVQGLEQFGEVQAQRYQDSFCKTFELLAFMPTIGRKSERHIIGERRFVHGSHVIYYLPKHSHVLNKAIRYGLMIRNIWGEN